MYFSLHVLTLAWIQIRSSFPIILELPGQENAQTDPTKFLFEQDWDWFVRVSCGQVAVKKYVIRIQKKWEIKITLTFTFWHRWIPFCNDAVKVAFVRVWPFQSHIFPIALKVARRPNVIPIRTGSTKSGRFFWRWAFRSWIIFIALIIQLGKAISN